MIGYDMGKILNIDAKEVRLVDFRPMYQENRRSLFEAQVQLAKSDVVPG